MRIRKIRSYFIRLAYFFITVVFIFGCSYYYHYEKKHGLYLGIVKHEYLRDFYHPAGFIEAGFHISGGDVQYAYENQEKAIDILPFGSGFDSIHFAIASTENVNILVESLFIKLKSFCSCELRDERYVSGGAGMTPQNSYSFYISEDYSIYPIYPISNDLTRNSWTYKGRDSDEFDVYFDYRPYVLYLISINLIYKDLNTGITNHIESDDFSLVSIAEGNVGGCLKIDNWYDPQKNQIPKKRKYDEGIPSDIYAFLSSDILNNRYLISKFISNKIFTERGELITGILQQRPENYVFRYNWEELTKYIQPK